MKTLVTGGAGYIGSHTCLALLEQGHDVVVVDNLNNSSAEALRRVSDLSGKSLEFFQTDMVNASQLRHVFEKHRFDSVIHFAGLKAVGESVEKPLMYYQNNLVSSLNLVQLMDEFDVRSLVFSSSATVYGEATEMPLNEKQEMSATNPYGRTKEQIEDILSDVGASDPRWRFALLRYFNPVGAHPSGQIGENPTGIPNNLFPYVSQVAVGKREYLNVFGDDYPTPDGTGVRDYIHVQDLAQGHIAALNYLNDHDGVFRWNLGTGRGYSVLEIVEAFSKAVGRPIPYKIAPRRAGDAPVSLADPSAALADLGWSATKNLDEMCEDTWRWQSANPQGYVS